MTLDIFRLQDDAPIKAERTASGDPVRAAAPSDPDLAPACAACAPGVAVLAGGFRRRSPR